MERHFIKMTQSQTVLRILYRHRRAVVVELERQLGGVVMEPQVAAVYEREKAVVAELEQKIKGAPN